MRREPWIAVALVASVLAVYGQTLDFGFVNWDDPDHVTHNPMVLRGLTLDGVVWALRASETGNWHPLTWLSHMLDVELFGHRAGGHHATNVALHALCSLLLFGVLRSATGAVWRSALVAGLFALHPLHVESVAWISERRDVLSTAFGLLAIGAYVAWVRRGGVLRYLLTALCFALSLTSKAMLVTLPFVLLLLDHWPLRRSQPGRRLLEKLPLLALAAAFSALAWVTQQGASAVIPEDQLAIPLRAANAAVAYVRYLGMLLWPARLAMFYPHPYIASAGGIPLAAWQIAGSLALLLAATALLLRARTRPYLAVGWLWYLGTLVPVIGLVQIGSQALADRYTYFPSIGLFVIVAWGGADVLAALRARSPSAERLAACVAGIALLALGATAWLQTRHWRDSRALFEHTVSAVPRNPLIRFNVANRLRDAGRLDDAIREYERALAETPDSHQIRINLANALRSGNQLDAAASHYRELLARDPDDAMAGNGLATVLRAQGQLALAEQLYRRAFARAPRGLAGYNLGNLLRDQQRLDEAIAVYRDALRHRGSDPRLYNNLGAALEASGDLDGARESYQIALRLDPGYELARRNLERARTLPDPP